MGFYRSVKNHFRERYKYSEKGIVTEEKNKIRRIGKFPNQALDNILPYKLKGVRKWGDE